MRSDWSRIALYLAVITLREVIIAGALDFKIAALHFVNVRRELRNAEEQTTILKNTKCAISFGVLPFIRN